jgi:hypothetical protein
MHHRLQLAAVIPLRRLAVSYEAHHQATASICGVTSGLARSGDANRANECLLSRGKRTSVLILRTSVPDPLRTFLTNAKITS